MLCVCMYVCAHTPVLNSDLGPKEGEFTRYNTISKVKRQRNGSRCIVTERFKHHKDW